MKKLKDCITILTIAVVSYGVMNLPNLIFDVSDDPENTPAVTEEVTELEPSKSSRSLDNIPEVTVQWEELKGRVEDSEGSEKASGDDSDEYFDVPLSEELQSHIFEQCEPIGLEPEIVIAVIYKESGYRHDVVGDSGRSFGLMQIQSMWHVGRMEELGCDDLLDPFDNVTVGIDILGDLMESGADEGKPIEWVLMAYNGGASYADTLMAEGRVSDYAKTVLNVSEELVVD